MDNLCISIQYRQKPYFRTRRPKCLLAYLRDFDQDIKTLESRLNFIRFRRQHLHSLSPSTSSSPHVSSNCSSRRPVALSRNQMASAVSAGHPQSQFLPCPKQKPSSYRKPPKSRNTELEHEKASSKPSETANLATSH